MNITDNVDLKERFVFWDSSSARNVRELNDKIKSMSPDIFVMYVNSQKNEFSNWILKNYNNKELANSVSKCPRKGEILYCLERAIKEDEQKKNLKMDGIFKRNEKEQEKLLQVISKPKEDISGFFIPEKPFFNIFNRKKDERKIFVPSREFKRADNKRVLIDEIIDGENKVEAPKTEKSNIFKQEDSPIIKVNKIQEFSVKDIIEKLKEVHRWAARQ